jgi:hypothetical protein
MGFVTTSLLAVILIILLSIFWVILEGSSDFSSENKKYHVDDVWDTIYELNQLSKSSELICKKLSKKYKVTQQQSELLYYYYLTNKQYTFGLFLLNDSSKQIKNKFYKFVNS